jgi:hypothetical protein
VFTGIKRKFILVILSDHSVEVYPFSCSETLSEKRLLHKYLLCSILVESIVQDIPTFLAYTTAL